MGTVARPLLAPFEESPARYCQRDPWRARRAEAASPVSVVKSRSRQRLSRRLVASIGSPRSLEEVSSVDFACQPSWRGSALRVMAPSLHPHVHRTLCLNGAGQRRG